MVDVYTAKASVELAHSANSYVLLNHVHRYKFAMSDIRHTGLIVGHAPIVNNKL